jgi:ABC-type spermidine/putrescine transport system permease subunit II
MKRSLLLPLTDDGFLVLVFFYAPLVVLVANSFNASRLWWHLGGVHLEVV